MSEETTKALQTMQQVLDGAIGAGVFKESTSVVLAHNALVHINNELLRLSQLISESEN